MTDTAILPEWEPRYATRAERMRASEIRELLKILDEPGVVSFAGGIPDPALFPLGEIQAAYTSILGDSALARSALQYSVSEGYLPLRQWIVRHMGTLGVPCTPDNILITCGSQQALEFLGRLLLSPGDTVLATAPTYLGALQAFGAYEPRYDVLEPEKGNCTAQSYADGARAAGGSVKAIYLVPDFANPSGETLSLGARERVLDLARELDVPVIEDSAYAQLRFAGEPQPCILARDVAHAGDIDRTRTVYCGTFSKTLAPGLRVGWIVASRPFIRRLVLVKQASDLNSAAINQMVMHRVAERCYDAQVQAARETYRIRATAMQEALARHMPPGVSWTKPEGGLFIWVTLPEHIDAAALLKRAVSEAQVAFVPGGAFFFDGSGRNTMRLSFSLPDPATIEAAIGRLAMLIRAW